MNRSINRTFALALMFGAGVFCGGVISANSAEPTANDKLCHNILAQFPSDHILVQVKGRSDIAIHCGDTVTRNPVHLIFNAKQDLDWYRTHEGHRTFIEGETDQD